MINWKVGAIMLALFGTSFGLRAIYTDKTSVDEKNHYIWYFAIWAVVVLESMAIWCLG